MTELNMHDVNTFHRWTVEQYESFWERITKTLQIVFKKKFEKICDLSQGVASPIWFKGALLNIADSCFIAPDNELAIVYEDHHKTLSRLSFGELNALSNRVANGLVEQGFAAGEPIGIIMPMDPLAVAIYLGIIKMGGIVVSIADSFSSDEIALRLKIAKAKAVFTQDFIVRGGKKFSLYEKVQQANVTRAIVLPLEKDEPNTRLLRKDDISWANFLSAHTTFVTASCDPMSACHILFSSGTTSEPKAIIWNHTTAIKAASDAYFHQNIQPNDVLVWPTNLGWMMGPWLIYAAFINRAAIALYTDAPTNRAFGEFVSRAHVTMLGVVPTMVAAWKETKCMEQLDWSTIKVFSSHG